MAVPLLWWLLACTDGSGPEDTDSDSHACACADSDTEPTTILPSWPAPSIEILVPGSIAIGPSIVVDIRVYDFVFIGPAIGDQTGGEQTGAWRPALPAWPLLGEGLAALEGTARAHEPTERPAGYIRLRLDGEIVAEEPASRFYLEGVEPGEYSLEAELVWLDGDTFFPPQIDLQSFTVQ